MVLDLRMGDVLRMRRKHPCGSLEWEVVRVGADIGLRCRGCGRRSVARALRRRGRRGRVAGERTLTRAR